MERLWNVGRRFAGRVALVTGAGGDPREIAETVLFVASDGAGYFNGQVLHVEGGWVPAG
jgi:hypothetical protein